MPPTNPLTGLGGQSRKPPAIDDALALLPLLTGGAPSPIPTTGGFLFGPEERALQHKIQTDAADYNRRQSEALIGLAAMAEEGRRRREQAAAARGFAATLPGANEAQTAYLASDPAALRTRSEQIGSSVAPPSQYQLGQLGLGERRAAATERQADIAARNAASLDRYRGLRADLAVLQEQRQAETDGINRRKIEAQTRKLEAEIKKIEQGAAGSDGLLSDKSEWERNVNVILRSVPPAKQKAYRQAMVEERLQRQTIASAPDPATGMMNTVVITPLDFNAVKARAEAILAGKTAGGSASSVPAPGAPVVGPAAGGPASDISFPTTKPGLHGATYLGEKMTETTRRERAMANVSLQATRELRAELRDSGPYPAYSLLVKSLPFTRARKLETLAEQSAAAISNIFYGRALTGPELQRRLAAFMPAAGDRPEVIEAKLTGLERLNAAFSGAAGDALVSSSRAAVVSAMRGGMDEDAAVATALQSALGSLGDATVLTDDQAARVPELVQQYMTTQGMSYEVAYEAAVSTVTGR